MTAASASGFLKPGSAKSEPLEKVCIASCVNYDIDTLKEVILKGFEELEYGLRDARVLLKPNLLYGRPPESAVTTHPAVIRALGELLVDRGCTVYVGDSPGYESTEKALRASGIMEVMEGLGMGVARFEGRIVKKWKGVSPYKAFTLGEDPRSFDAVINLPKFKSHTMMGLTMGVKNTFGFVPSKEKARWHLRAGKDRLLFASVLIDIHNIVNPSLTMLDGVMGMDGEGPGSGRARHFGLIAMSRDAYALDDVMEGLVGVSSTLPISEVARKHGLIRKYEVVDFGAPLVEGFAMARTTDTDWALPAFAKRVLTRLFVKKPKVRKALCKGCGLCATICPACALVLSDGLPVFDYRKCIRCYCCQEMCPEGGIRV
jgi:uncharacterized protein (DUF362 family)/Pyruvate/2-oxoacid:ferredoxin oxidoreductase delta subunit